MYFLFYEFFFYISCFFASCSSNISFFSLHYFYYNIFCYTFFLPYRASIFCLVKYNIFSERNIKYYYDYYTIQNVYSR